jgi:hypothetical protein
VRSPWLGPGFPDRVKISRLLSQEAGGAAVPGDGGLEQVARVLGRREGRAQGPCRQQLQARLRWVSLQGSPHEILLDLLVFLQLLFGSTVLGIHYGQLRHLEDISLCLEVIQSSCVEIKAKNPFVCHV